MNKTPLKIPTMREEEVSLCPYCGGVPIVEVEIKKKTFESDRITNQEVCCPCCGLGAPRKVWETICSSIKTPLAPDDPNDE